MKRKLIIIIFLFSGFLIFSLLLFEIKILIDEKRNIYHTAMDSLESKIADNKKEIKILQRRIDEISTITVKATAYNAVPEQTDNEPDVNACRKQPRIGRIAVSQDLYYKGWTCGKWVDIKGFGIFQIDDKMHKRKTNQVDIIKETIPEAIEFGIVRNLNAVLLTHYDEM